MTAGRWVPAEGTGAVPGRSWARICAMAVLTTLGLVVGWSLYRQPKWLLRRFARRSSDVLYYVDTTAPLVALTIDDGPYREGMPRILDVLAANDAHATFFLISGNVAGREDLVRRARAEGHEIGNHTTADRPSIQLSPPDFERDLLAAEAVLRPYGLSRWFRPGSGYYNRQMLATVREHRYQLALASIYPMDAHVPSEAYSMHKVVSHAEPGAIILLHDGPTRGPRTAAVLEQALPELRRRGFEVVTLTELVRAGARAQRSAPGY